MMMLLSLALTNLFQSTPSVKRVTIGIKIIQEIEIISIHTLCEEGDFIAKNAN